MSEPVITPAAPASSPVADPKQDDTTAAIKAAVEAERIKWEQDAAAKAAKAKEEAEADEAREQGEWQKLAEKEKAKREELEQHNRTLRRQSMIGTALLEHPDYAKERRKYVEAYLVSNVPADVEGEPLAKAIREGIAEYVKDNPVEKKSTGAAPTPMRGSVRIPATRQATVPARRFSTLTSNI